MADRITDLSALTVPANSDELAIEDVSANATMKITRENLFKGAPLPADTIDNQAIQDDGALPGKWSNPYCFRAYAGASTTLTDATTVQIALNTESYDYNNNFASNAYTAPVAGVYNFSGSFSISGAVGTGVDAIAMIYVNGSEAMRGQRNTAISDGGYLVSGDLLLAAGDVVTFRGYQNSAGGEVTATGSHLTWFTGHIVHQVN